VLHLANSSEVEDKIASEGGRVAKLVRAKKAPAKAIEELYLAALARYPTKEEMKKGLTYLARQKDVRGGLEDLAWVLLNTREFMFNH
jgi:hypothetical protein